VVSSTLEGCSVEVSVGALNQPILGPVAVNAAEEVVQDGKSAAGSDFEDGAAAHKEAATGAACATKGRCPVEVAIGGLNQRNGGAAVGSAESVQRGQLPSRGEFKDRAQVVGAISA